LTLINKILRLLDTKCYFWALTSAKKLRLKTGKTWWDCAAVRALVILPEAMDIVRQQGAKGPGPKFYQFCRAKAMSAKKHLC